MKVSGHKMRSVPNRYNIVDDRDVVEAGRQLAAFHKIGNNSGTKTETELFQPLIIN
jgi:hypothetical protein